MPTQIRTAQIQDLAITNLKQNFGTPSAGTDVAIKSYTDTAISNAIGLLNLKDKVIVATTVNGALATAYANAQVVDGYALVTGDRILLKNQTAGAENGIYTVNATGAPTRSTDTDTAAKIQDAFVGVQRGTANADTQWKMVTDPPLTIGTTALVWTQQGSAGLTS